MIRSKLVPVFAAAIAAVTLTSCGSEPTSSLPVGPSDNSAAAAPTTTSTVQEPPGDQVYGESRAGKLSETAKAALPRIYAPNRQTNNVSVIDPSTMQVVDTLKVGINPQHVIPSWDLKRLWVANNAEGTHHGSLTPIDPTTGKIMGPNVVVDDPYNLYFTPDGVYAVVVAEARKRLDFRDPQTMEMKFSISTPTCGGINHMDYSLDGSYMVATCENASRLVKIDWKGHKVLGTLDLGYHVMPQDIRLGPDAKTFYVADMMTNQVILVDGDTFKITKKIDVAQSGGYGPHGLYPSRDGKLLYVANRGSEARGYAPPNGKGSVSVIDWYKNEVVANWPVPEGGSPDMGGVSEDGTRLWLSGRYDDEVYVFDTVAGTLVAKIPVGNEPHGLAVWPQPGRYSLGHTGNMR